METKLPELFTKRMKDLLGEEFDSYLACLKEKNYGGLRVNTLKLSPQEFEAIRPFPIERVPWIRNGYYYGDEEKPAKHPYYYAGLYYLQEPSAMTPASLLPVTPGDRVLDLCAAPGGKSTELAAKLRGQGVLAANDISNSRAKALLKNIELFGVKNAVVLSEAPAKLAGSFEGYFDKILVDAPCSGEGMFRKSPAIMKNWEQYGVDYYHKLQLEILPSAVRMLAPGGCLLYSTCTFSPEEDEQTMTWLLNSYPDLEPVKLPGEKNIADEMLSYEGFDTGRPEWAGGNPAVACALRLWPHKLKGEGHFIAMFRKKKGTEYADSGTGFSAAVKKAKLTPEAEEFLKRLRCPIDLTRIEERDGRLFLAPKGLPELKGLRILRTGLYLGEMKKNRFEPGQALALALNASDFDNRIDLCSGDERVIRYLKCESIEADGADGFALVCVDGYPLGWGKLNGGILKNKYLPGWRYL